jgi:hypothetical protein
MLNEALYQTLRASRTSDSNRGFQAQYGDYQIGLEFEERLGRSWLYVRLYRGDYTAILQIEIRGSRLLWNLWAPEPGDSSGSSGDLFFEHGFHRTPPYAHAEDLLQYLIEEVAPRMEQFTERQGYQHFKWYRRNGDEHTRKLERLASQGDREAHEQLLNQAARTGLIPSKAELQSMRHGWVVGNTNDPNPNAAAEFILETWKTLLEGLGERAYDWYQSYYNDPESQGEYDDSEFEYENFQIELQNLSKGFVDPDSVFTFLEPLHEYINGYLEATSGPQGDNIPLDLKGEQGDFGGGRVTDVDGVLFLWLIWSGT